MVKYTDLLKFSILPDNSIFRFANHSMLVACNKIHVYRGNKCPFTDCFLFFPEMLKFWMFFFSNFTRTTIFLFYPCNTETFRNRTGLLCFIWDMGILSAPFALQIRSNLPCLLGYMSKFIKKIKKSKTIFINIGWLQIMEK